MAIRTEPFADIRLSEFRELLRGEDTPENDSPERVEQNSQLETAVELALADDQQIGPNDAPALKAFAKQLGRGDVAPLIDGLRKKYEAPPIRVVPADTPYAARVVSYTPGPGAFSSRLSTPKHPRLDLALGQPKPLNNYLQSLEVVSLGRGGSITLALGVPATKAVAIRSNVFLVRGTNEPAGQKSAVLKVSSDLHNWKDLGLVGYQRDELRLLSAAGIKPGTPIRYVRLTDVSQTGSGFGLLSALGS